MGDIPAVNPNADPDGEKIWILPDLKVPRDPVRHLLKEMIQKYGEEEARARVDKAREHLEKLLDTKGLDG